MDKFLQELMNLVTDEGSNLDYYLSGYVDADAISELIKKHYGFNLNVNNLHRNPRDIPKDTGPVIYGATFKTVYGEAIARQLDSIPLFMKMDKNKEGGFVVEQEHHYP